MSDTHYQYYTIVPDLPIALTCSTKRAVNIRAIIAHHLRY